jgi:hypothetical protein
MVNFGFAALNATAPVRFRKKTKKPRNHFPPAPFKGGKTTAIAMKSLRLPALALFAFAATALTAFAGDPNGTWKVKAEAANGRSLESTLTLTWADNQLSGTIDNRAGKADIKDATFANDEIKFTVVRKFGRGFRKKTFTTHYTGKLEGDAITGTLETTGRDQQPVSIPWQAERQK